MDSLTMQEITKLAIATQEQVDEWRKDVKVPKDFNQREEPSLNRGLCYGRAGVGMKKVVIEDKKMLHGTTYTVTYVPTYKIVEHVNATSYGITYQKTYSHNNTAGSGSSYSVTYRRYSYSTHTDTEHTDVARRDSYSVATYKITYSGSRTTHTDRHTRVAHTDNAPRHYYSRTAARHSYDKVVCYGKHTKIGSPNGDRSPNRKYVNYYARTHTVYTDIDHRDSYTDRAYGRAAARNSYSRRAASYDKTSTARAATYSHSDTPHNNIAGADYYTTRTSYSKTYTHNNVTGQSTYSVTYKKVESGEHNNIPAHSEFAGYEPIIGEVIDDPVPYVEVSPTVVDPNHPVKEELDHTDKWDKIRRDNNRKESTFFAGEKILVNIEYEEEYKNAGGVKSITLEENGKVQYSRTMKAGDEVKTGEKETQIAIWHNKFSEWWGDGKSHIIKITIVFEDGTKKEFIITIIHSIYDALHRAL